MMIRLLVPLVACISLGCDYPRDASETSRRVQQGVIRAGVIGNPPWVNLGTNTPSGIEPQLLQILAESLSAKIEWTIGSETMLIKRLEQRQLDVVIGGLDKDTPWSGRIGISQWYLLAIDPVTSKKSKHVWAVMPGESRWLLEIDRFLQSRRSEARDSLLEAQARLPTEALR
jgi:polar amino acid transport system substrate-binding protein